MKATAFALVISAAVALPLATAGAQEKSTTPGQEVRKDSAALLADTAASGKTIRLTGCFGKAEGAETKYALTQVEMAEGQKKLDENVMLDFSGLKAPPKEQIDTHIGHQIQVSGTLKTPKEKGGGAYEMKVTELRHVAASCPGTPTASSGGAMDEGASLSAGDPLGAEAPPATAPREAPGRE